MTHKLIVIIDDDKLFTEAAILLLEDYGYKVDRAFTGRSGLLRVYNEHPDLVILDVHLPDINGLNIASELREAHPSTPLIIISSDDSREIVARCLSMQRCTFMRKPLSPERLMTTIDQAFAGGNGHR